MIFILIATNFCRDQNFGLSELAAIQDIRNEFNLQDITDEPPAAAQQTTQAPNDRGKCNRTEPHHLTYDYLFSLSNHALPIKQTNKQTFFQRRFLFSSKVMNLSLKQGNDQN